MADETIVMLKQRGINNIDFYPYYPKCKENYENIPLVITPGEPQLVPQGRDFIDLDHRVLDTNTLLELFSFTDCEYLLETDRIINYFDEISGNNTGIESLIDKMGLAAQQFTTLLQISNEGIILVDNHGNIIMCNQKACDLLEKNRINLLYKQVFHIFENDVFEISLKEQVSKYNFDCFFRLKIEFKNNSHCKAWHLFLR